MGSKKAATRKASKRSTTRKVSDTSGKLGEVRALIRKARKEVARLLAHEVAGTITRTELETGLEELADQLEKMDLFQDVV
jgi:hypothetical protein